MSEWFISSICFKKRTTYYLVLSLAINIPLTVGRVKLEVRHKPPN